MRWSSTTLLSNIDKNPWTQRIVYPMSSIFWALGKDRWTPWPCTGEGRPPGLRSSTRRGRFPIWWRGKLEIRLLWSVTLCPGTGLLLNWTKFSDISKFHVFQKIQIRSQELIETRSIFLLREFRRYEIWIIPTQAFRLRINSFSFFDPRLFNILKT